jgi:hypothetical protein
LFVWSNAVKAALPVGATGAVTFFDNPAGRPDRYTIEVRWREAGADADSSYQLVLEVLTK